MQTVSGILRMNKTERKEIETVLAHCENDISFGGGGTFTMGDNENSTDTKEIERAKRGIAHVRWILSTYLD